MHDHWIQLDARGQAALETHWRHRFPPGATLLGCSAFGDPFLVAAAGEVHWLNTGTAECTRVAGSLAEFEAALQRQPASWLLPRLAAALEAEGKFLADGECFTYAILPVFAEGKYEPWNFRPVPAWQHFEVTAQVHGQLEGMPDGTKVRLRVE